MIDGATLADRGPSAPSTRIAAIDVLRGFALIGILLINIRGMGQPIGWTQPVTLPNLSDPDWQAWWASMLLVEGAMRGLFSMLFGAGMLLFLRELRTGQGDPQAGRRLLFVRRALWLLVFGTVNSTLLLWPGDILLIYGLAAFLILPLARARPKTLIAVAGGVLVLIAIWSAFNALGGPPDAQALAKQGDDLVAEHLARMGGYGANLAFMWKTTLEWNLTPNFVWWILDAAAAMLLGMALLRLGVLTGEAPARLYRGLALVGFGFGVPLGLVQGWLEWSHYLDPQPLAALISQPRRLLLSLGWLGLIMALWKSAAPRALFAPLAALGRMALTLYLAQSIIGAVIFAGFGLGLFGRLDGLQLWAVAAAIMVAQAAFAMAWLARFRFGPMEWLWRTLTYGKAP